MSGSHVLKTWSSTQATVSLSSAEAELYALVKGASQTLGMMSVGRDLGLDMHATVHSDAAAALGIIQRQGVGKLRHIATQYLWIQERTRAEDFDIAKVLGDDNPADVLTKNVSAELLHKHLETLGVEIRHDRAGGAPQLARANPVGLHGDPDGGLGDEWLEPERGVITRKHEHPRQELFTPLRVAGSPTAKGILSTRVTEGRFTGSQKTFTIVDSWRARGTAHRRLDEPWTGTTKFLYSSN